jgi:hypothetical protein
LGLNAKKNRLTDGWLQRDVFTPILLFLLYRKLHECTCDFNGWLTTGSKYLFILLFCTESGEKKGFFFFFFFFGLLNYIWKFASGARATHSRSRGVLCACAWTRVEGRRWTGRVWRRARVNFGCALFLDALSFPGQKGLSHASGP